MTVTHPRRSGARRSWFPFLVAAVLATLAGCGRDEVAHYRVPKQAPDPAVATASVSPGMTPGSAGVDVPPPPAPRGKKLRWSLPARWTESAGGRGMRFATLGAPVEGQLDVSVTVLPGPAGGELANVNRWRGQIGLGNLDEAALAKARKPVRTNAGDIALYDFTSDGQTRSRVVAGLAMVDGNTWFIKMTGDEKAVAAARPDFLRIVESLRLEPAN
jgi:hypothetical protein